MSLASSEVMASSSQHFQSCQGAGAVAELVHFQTEALEHRYVEVAQRRVALRVESEVLAVFEAAPGEQHRHVLDAVDAGVGKVAAEEHRGPLEQGGAVFLGVLQLLEEVAQGLHHLGLD